MNDFSGHDMIFIAERNKATNPGTFAVNQLVIDRAGSLGMEERWRVCVRDRGQHSPIQSELIRLADKMLGLRQSRKSSLWIAALA